MWFAKWFGGRDELDDTDEPARYAAPEVTKPSQPEARQPAPAAGESRVGARKKGFDPYNSGSFERRNAWERIGRR